MPMERVPLIMEGLYILNTHLLRSEMSGSGIIMLTAMEEQFFAFHIQMHYLETYCLRTTKQAILGELFFQTRCQKYITVCFTVTMQGIWVVQHTALLTVLTSATPSCGIILREKVNKMLETLISYTLL